MATLTLPASFHVRANQAKLTMYKIETYTKRFRRHIFLE